MHKKITGLVLCAMLFALCLPAAAQQPKKVSRIGYLSAQGPASDSPRSEAIRAALRELGYTEGQNIVIEFRYAEGKFDRAAKLAAELVGLKVDIILVTGGGRLIQPTMNATKTIPIVMTGLGADPVEAGLIESLARPGGNVTGITMLVRKLAGKRLELLKEAVPKLARVAIFFEPVAAAAAEMNEIQGAASALRLTIQRWEVGGVDGMEKVFAAINKARPDGLYVMGGGLIAGNRKRTVDFALKSRLPSMFADREYVDAGGLMSYGADLTESYRRVAYFVDRILKGTKPADLPVEQPTKFEFVVNLKTAKQIGVTIPQSVLYRANRVIN
jgi:putative ABC transport system substrate-binding protein